MEPTAQSIARTYPERVYEDPWDRVIEYRRVRSYSADRPNMGSSALSNALDLPRGRIRPWVNGGAPESVKAIQTALDHNWLNPDPGSEMALRLTELLAHVLAGGSIAKENPVVSLSPGRRVGVDELRTAFECVGIEATVRHADDDRQGTEVVATKDGVALGRCLIAMGAEPGHKTELESLPDVLDVVPDETRPSFAAIYARHRASEYPEKATLRITERRSRSYMEGLAQLFRDVTGETVTLSDAGITISAAAARELALDNLMLEKEPATSGLD